jgi:hypothetical protein
MVKARGVLRTYPGGAAASGLTVTIKKEVDDSTVTSDVTDGDGVWDYSANGSPGPWRWEGVDTAPTPDANRIGSTLASGGGGAYSLAELVYALRVLGNGVIDNFLNELAITDPDSGTNLAYATGGVVVNGIPAIWSSSGTHAIATAQDATNPKKCYLVIRVTGAGEAEEGKAVLVDVCGAAAASPSLPSLTQTEASYDYPLATFTLGNSASSNANDVTALADVRTFLLTHNPAVVAIGRRTDPAVSMNITSTTGEDVTLTSGSASPTLVSGVAYDLVGTCFLLVKAAAGQTISIAPRINGVDGTYISSNVSADYIGIGNSFETLGVTGAGALTCSLRAKVSGGTGVVLTGFISVVCVPRT